MDTAYFGARDGTFVRKIFVFENTPVGEFIEHFVFSFSPQKVYNFSGSPIFNGFKS